MRNLFRKFYVSAMLFITPLACFAGKGDVDTSKLRVAMGVGIGLMFLVGFAWCINTIWEGVKEKKKGNPEWSNSILAGLMIPGAIIITAIIFTAMGLGGANTAATFDAF